MSNISQNIINSNRKPVMHGTVTYYLTSNNQFLNKSEVIHGIAFLNYVFTDTGKYNITAIYKDTLESIGDCIVVFEIIVTDSRNQIEIHSENITCNIFDEIELIQKFTDKYGNPINTGTIQYKLDGTSWGSFKLTTSETLLQLTLNSSGKHVLETIYHDNENYKGSSNYQIITVNKLKSYMTIETSSNPRPMETMTIRIRLNDNVGTNMKNVCSLKINEKIVMNKTKPLLISVKNNEAIYEYAIPLELSNSTINLTAHYSGDNIHEQIIKTSTIHILQKEATIHNNISINGKIMTITSRVYDENSVYLNNGRISISLNGKWIGSPGIKNGTSIMKYNFSKSGVYTIQTSYINANNEVKDLSTEIVKV